jgi:uncharacterized protein YggU (UPF0235/DUF167 family)
VNRGDAEASATVAVRLTPRGGADRVDGVVDGVLHVRVASPPLDGQANAALTRLIARELKVAPSAVRVVRGSTGRTKVLEVTGVERSAIAARWPDLGV